MKAIEAIKIICECYKHNPCSNFGRYNNHFDFIRSESMGKKYIIELLDDCQSEFKGIIVFGLTPSNQISAEPIPVEDLTPYTEPDMERVRKEAYDKGYDDAAEEKYTDGLADAWDAAQKIVLLVSDGGLGMLRVKDIFGEAANSTLVLRDSKPADCVEKIRQYEQEKEEQITKGDIVLIKSTPEVEILVTYADEEYVSGIALTEVDDNCEIGDQYSNIRIRNVKKTGKHYDIASVLQKMREESNG